MIQRLFFIFFISLFTLSTINAQGPGPGKGISKEEFRNRQQKYFMEKSGITEDEASKFFPLYYELQDKKAQINNKVWGNTRDIRGKNLSEQECSDMIQKVAEAKIASDKLELEYIPKFKKIISSKKLLRLQIAEMRFHRDMLKIMHRPPMRQDN